MRFALSIIRNGKLPFGELGSLSCFFQTVLAAFLFPRIAGQQAGFLQQGTEVSVHFQQGTGNTMTDCTSLAGDAAANNVGQYIIFAQGFSGVQRLPNNQFQGLQAEIFTQFTAVYNDLAFARNKANTGNRAFAAAFLVLLSS